MTAPTIVLFIGLSIFYLFHIHPNGDMGRLSSQVLSIAERGKLSVNDYRNSYKIADISHHDGYFYPGTAPGLSFISAPIYLAVRKLSGLSSTSLFPGYPKGEQALTLILLTFLLVSVPTFLTSLLLVKYATKNGMEKRWGLGLIILYCTASPAFPYGVVFGYESIVNLISLYVFLGITEKAAPEGRGRHIALGFCIGMLPLLWHHAGILSIILGLILLYRAPGPALKHAIPAFLIPVGILLIYQWVIFGNPLAVPYNYRYGPEASFLVDKTLGASFPSISIMWKLIAGSRRGLLITMPLALISFISIKFLFKKKAVQKNIALCAAWGIFLIYFIFNSSLPHYWHSGTGVFGPRYLMPTLPFLFIMLIQAIRSVPSPIVVILGALSFMTNLSGAHYVQPYDIDSIIMFLIKGPNFDFVTWLNAIPEHARVRFPDIYPASQQAFTFALIFFMTIFAGLAYLLIHRPGQSKSGYE